MRKYIQSMIWNLQMLEEDSKFSLYVFLNESFQLVHDSFSLTKLAEFITYPVAID